MEKRLGDVIKAQKETIELLKNSGIVPNHRFTLINFTYGHLNKEYMFLQQQKLNRVSGNPVKLVFMLNPCFFKKIEKMVKNIQKCLLYTKIPKKSMFFRKSVPHKLFSDCMMGG